MVLSVNHVEGFDPGVLEEETLNDAELFRINVPKRCLDETAEELKIALRRGRSWSSRWRGRLVLGVLQSIA